MPRPRAKACTDPMAMLRTNTGGRCDARVISHPEVPSRPIPQAAEATPDATDGRSRRGESATRLLLTDSDV